MCQGVCLDLCVCVCVCVWLYLSQDLVRLLFIQVLITLAHLSSSASLCLCACVCVCVCACACFGCCFRPTIDGRLQPWKNSVELVIMSGWQRLNAERVHLQCLGTRGGGEKECPLGRRQDNLKTCVTHAHKQQAATVSVGYISVTQTHTGLVMM